VPHQQDRRAVLLELTTAGRELSRQLGEATGRLTAEMASRLSAADIGTLTGLLHTLLDGTDVAQAIRSRFPHEDPTR
jgi:DNA-binding MarR family transcriptional regulator